MLNIVQRAYPPWRHFKTATTADTIPANEPATDMAAIAPAERPPTPPLSEFEVEEDVDEGPEYDVRDVTPDIKGVADVATPCPVIANGVSNC